MVPRFWSRSAPQHPMSVHKIILRRELMLMCMNIAQSFLMSFCQRDMGKTSCSACSCKDDMLVPCLSAAPFVHASCLKPKRCDRSVLSPLGTSNCRAQYAIPLLPRLLHGSGAVRVDPPLQVFERLDPPTTVAGRTAQPYSG